MREIKFRAWKASTQEMISWYGLLHDYSGMLADVLSGIYLSSVMQYTGLKDKNGVEIYEGDIVQVGKHPNPASIFFDKGSFWVTKQEENHWISNRLLSNIVSEAHNIAEVIGNVHENPELLEAS